MKTNSKMIYLFAAGHAVDHIYVAIIPPLLPFWQALFHMSYSQVGLLLALFTVGGLLQVVFGSISDKYRCESLLIAIGLFSSAVLALSLGFTSQISLLFTLTFLLGVATGVYHPPGISLVTKFFVKGRGKALGLHSIGEGAGFAAAPLVLALASLLMGWRSSLFLFFTPGVIVGALYLRVGKSPSQETREEEKASFRLSIRPLGTLMLSLYLGGVPIICTTFFPVYFTSVFHADPSTASFLLGLLYIVSMLSGPIGGWASDRRGVKFVMVTTFVLESFLLCLFALLRFSYVIYILLIAMGLFYFAYIPAFHTYIASVSPERLRATAYAIVLTGFSVCSSFLSVVIGAMMDTYGAQYTFILMGLLGLVGGLAGLLLEDVRR